MAQRFDNLRQPLVELQNTHPLLMVPITSIFFMVNPFIPEHGNIELQGQAKDLEIYCSNGVAKDPWLATASHRDRSTYITMAAFPIPLVVELLI